MHAEIHEVFIESICYCPDLTEISCLSINFTSCPISNFMKICSVVIALLQVDIERQALIKLIGIYLQI